MRSCIQVNTYGVNTVLNNAGKSLVHAVLRHIVLILTNADSLWINFNKLRKGIL